MTVVDRLPGARDRVALVADPGSFEPWDEQLVGRDPLAFADRVPYRERLAAARELTGEPEAVVTGRATVDGRPVAVVASEFRFLGGSIGTATGERIARAFERACVERLPLVALTASGGTRMQEGTLALMQMAKLAAAAERLRAAGLPYVACLMHPTTGGVLASWASLASVTFAEPGAQIGFAGPRVAELLTGSPLPAGVQTAERLHERGLVDDLVPAAELRERVARVLAVAASEHAPGEHAPGQHAPGQHAPGDAAQGDAVAVDPPRLDPAPLAGGDAWASVAQARDPRRPGGAELLARWATDVTPLRGDGGGGEDPACLAALARVAGLPVVAIAQARGGAAGPPAAMGPAGYRKARRAIALAEQLRLPLVTLVDTPGAELSAAAEEGGLAAEIARCLAALATARVPTLAVLAGEGGSGGAIALLAADRVICAEHAYLAPIAPEGASAILYRDVEQAPALAARQGIASWELAQAGIVDVVVPERPAGAQDPDAFAAALGRALGHELRTLVARPQGERLAEREQRYRQIGNLERERQA